MKHHQIASVIEKAVKQTIHHRGLRGRGLVLDIYADKDGKWTAVEMRPDGFACVIMAGEHWVTISPEPDGEPA